MTEPSLPAHLVVFLLGGLLMVWPVCRVFARAGFNARWGLIMLVPYAGPLICLMLLAHRPWPNKPAAKPAPPRRREKRDLRTPEPAKTKGDNRAAQP